MTIPFYETKAVVRTPGGRVGDDSSHNTSPKENWIEKRGGLPRYVRIVRNGLMREGMSEGKATAFAIAAIKRWAAGGDDVTPKVQAEAAKALVEWEAMKGSKDDDVSDIDFKDAAAATLLADMHDLMNDSTETKDDTAMQLETKQTAAVGGLTVIDEKKGIVELFASVTGLRDNVKDVIEPGAYEKTLVTRNPKGVYAHKWDMPISKALEAKELMPGSPELPKTLPNGDPWPAGAGALKIKAQFNMKTQRGRDAFEDVVFYGDEQEWSIGYQVPAGGARMNAKTATRHIDYLELYEFSPVLFGAMSAARTSSVKDALAEADVSEMTVVEFKSFLLEHGLELHTDEEKGLVDEAAANEEGIESKAAGERPGHRPGTGYSDPDDDEPEEDDDEDEAKVEPLDGPNAYEYDWLVKARDAINAVLDDAPDGAEFKADTLFDDLDTKGVAEVIAKHAEAFGEWAAEMKDAAEAFDTAYDLDDSDGLNDFGEKVLEVVEKALDAANESDNPPALIAASHKVAAAVASMAPVDEDAIESPEARGNDGEKGGAIPLPPKPKTKDTLDDDAEVVVEAKSIEDMLRVGLSTRRR